jgi:hypothetical protein
VFNTTAFACDLSLRLIARGSGLQQELSAMARAAADPIEAVVIHAGEREKAVAFMRTWLRQHQPAYLKICDPYFSTADLDLLMLIKEIIPGCRVQLLTSDKKQRDVGLPEPFEEAYRAHWRRHVSDQDPPDTDVTVVSMAPNGDSPIHDRWVVGDRIGLRLGTSFSGMGGSKVSEISILEPLIAADREREVDQYLTRQLRDIQGRRVRYNVFSLM